MLFFINSLDILFSNKRLCLRKFCFIFAPKNYTFPLQEFIKFRFSHKGSTDTKSSKTTDLGCFHCTHFCDFCLCVFRFEMVVKLAGKCLSPHVYSLISHIEVSYSEL